MRSLSIINLRHGLAALALAGLFVAPAGAQSNYTESADACGTYSAIGGAGGVRLNTVSSCDDCTELVNLPFTFMWNGDESITAVRVSSNGQINIDSTDFSSNFSLSDGVVTAGAYTQPRIAVAQEDLAPNQAGDIYTLDTGSSFIISFEGLDFWLSGGDVNAQAELWPNGDVEMRWGHIDDAGHNRVAVGLEDDTNGVPWADPADGASFGPDGVVSDPDSLTGQCRRWSTCPADGSPKLNGPDQDGCFTVSCAGPGNKVVLAMGFDEGSFTVPNCGVDMDIHLNSYWFGEADDNGEATFCGLQWHARQQLWQAVDFDECETTNVVTTSP